MVTKKPMEEDEFIEEEAEDFDDFEEEQPKPKAPPRQPPLSPPQVERTNKFAEKPKPEPENRYGAIHSQQVDGIFDRRTNKVLSQDLWEVQAEILSVLRRIEESLG